VQNAVEITKQYAKRVSAYKNTDDAVARELEQLLQDGQFQLDPKHEGALAFAGPAPAPPAPAQ